MKDENVDKDWASFMDHLADQVTFAGRSHWGEKDESGNWPNLSSSGEKQKGGAILPVIEITSAAHLVTVSALAAHARCGAQ